MDILLSAVLGELTTRSINFFVSKFSEQSPLDVEDRLCRLLLRAQVIVDEAMGRRVTNQAMLLQMELLRDAMQRGYYRLDTVRSQCHEQETNDDKVVRHSLSFSTVCYLKGLCFSSRNKLVIEQLHGTLDDLISVIHDLEEFVVFLTTYPRLYCQPYSMHLELANCMFGRQMEAGLVLDFLLRPQVLGAELDVMPIVGPAHVGKSTLVTHVCNVERVRAHFLEIMSFHIQGFKDGELASFRDECELKHKNCTSESNLDGRSLVVIELIGDLSEDAWCRFYSASKLYVPRGSKIIVTSRFDNIVKFGTTRALTLNYLSHEAYWYFFKTLTFGSMDPKSHPRLTHLAMEIARSQRRCHIGANMIAHLLRDNFNARFWSNVLAFVRGSRSRSAVSTLFRTGCSQNKIPRCTMWKCEASWEI
ncbi:putative disease resistance protein RGA3 [Miscanthus floridulus]|uniref:putative disease resistance protein RGA3 n=1 Tax=Miscanthus floridulus TaxID=154761 RepID=UPI0034582892